MIVAVPSASPVACPLLAVASLMGATLSSLLSQVTYAVMSCDEPSAKVPSAAYCWVASMAMLAVAGVTAMEASAEAETVMASSPVTPAYEA